MKTFPSIALPDFSFGPFNYSGWLLPLLLTVFLFGQARADSGFIAPGSNPSIAELLNSDGTLNLYTGFSGSLNLAGFQIDFDQRKGIIANPSRNRQSMMVAGWSALGSGLNNTCRAIFISGTDVYVGGDFTNAGGVAINRIAKWDGSTWSALGSGLNNSCYGITVSGTDVYAAGSFTTAGGVGANRIAKWNGTSWTNLGNGFNNTCFAVAVSGTNVYVSGSFDKAGVGNANYRRIAYWTGAIWLPLGFGLSGDCNAFAIVGTNVYATGSFTQAGGLPASYIAVFDGVNTWSALGSGLSNPGLSLAVSGSDIYVGGHFVTAGGVPANRIAKWDGSTWSALGSGLGNICTSIAISGTDIYVGGQFTDTGGSSANYIAKWNGSAWSTLGSGLSGNCNAITSSGTDIYVGGLFTAAGGTSANRIARWEGAVLPVELIDFSGRIQDNHSHLSWQTASETRNKGFDIERSADGYDWTRIGFVPALGDGNGLQEYAFTDQKPLSGQNYYRLKQWDLDGQYEYSKVISMNIAGKDKQTGMFYPNPARSGLVSLEYYAEKEADLTISVFDATGRLVLRQTQAMEAGRNVLQFDFSQLTAGTYIVHLNDGTNPVVRDLIIE